MAKEAATYGMMVDDSKSSRDFWPNAMKTGEKGKVALKTLCYVGGQIKKTIALEDIVLDAHLVNAHAQDAIVEDKRKRDEDILSPIKRVTRASDKREDEAKPTLEVAMQDVAKDKKFGKLRGLAYKLKSKIEMTTDLQKVFKERILNSRVDLTLVELLGIAKPEFHANFNDMVKRKQQIPC
ncbi:hypothetical protein L7F22_043473 [Adiantum nelumboides]|nr:hypothetical protein [Adiantum nelumboides]